MPRWLPGLYRRSGCVVCVLTTLLFTCLRFLLRLCLSRLRSNALTAHTDSKDKIAAVAENIAHALRHCDGTWEVSFDRGLREYLSREDVQRWLSGEVVDTRYEPNGTATITIRINGGCRNERLELRMAPDTAQSPR